LIVVDRSLPDAPALRGTWVARPSRVGAAGGGAVHPDRRPTHTDWPTATLQRDERGFLLTGRDLLRDGRPPRAWPLDRPPLLLETSLPGVFAAGDVRHGSVKRVASAVGEGATAVQLVHHYLDDTAPAAR
jgi:thioredoxin reductase